MKAERLKQKSPFPLFAPVQIAVVQPPANGSYSGRGATCSCAIDFTSDAPIEIIPTDG